jgi:predicted PolB exonuclease-like 3'-5' exonuclease
MDLNPLEVPLEDILFLDIETVSAAPTFEALPPMWQELFAEKTRFEREKEGLTPAEFYPKRAGIQAEFGQVVVIGLGYLDGPSESRQLRVKSLANGQEKALLEEFALVLHAFARKGRKFPFLCAHNGKEFDFPYLSRRLLAHGLPLPKQLATAGKKPWEVHHLDTMELWKFGDRKHYTSLKLLAALFGLPSPKEDMDGSQVGPEFWEHNNLEGIARYCRRDVVTLAQVYLRMCGKPPLDPEHIAEIE